METMRLAELAAEAAVISLHGSVPSPAKQTAKQQGTKQGAKVEASRGGQNKRNSGERSSGKDTSEGEGSMLAAMPAEVAILVRRSWEDDPSVRPTIKEWLLCAERNVSGSGRFGGLDEGRRPSDYSRGSSLLGVGDWPSGSAGGSSSSSIRRFVSLPSSPNRRSNEGADGDWDVLNTWEGSGPQVPADELLLTHAQGGRI